MFHKTPKSLRLHIGLFGRTNVGKSSFLNFVAGQDVAITSDIPGTTTDTVYKTMELLPLGPVVFLDTAGLDDVSVLSSLRIEKTKKMFDACDCIVIITEPDVWTGYEEEVLREAHQRKSPVIIVVNKTDLKNSSPDFCAQLKEKADKILFCSSFDFDRRDYYVNVLKKYLIEISPDHFLNSLPLIGDLMPRQGLAVLIVPIDLEAPKGRIILPQVQTIRDALDNNGMVLVVKESEYLDALKKLHRDPDLVVCDSQVVSRMVEETPPQVKCTTFSILFSRYKGDLPEEVKGAMAIRALKPFDRVLIAEACSHHAIEGDIGRIKIPDWLRKYVGGDLMIDVCAGSDYPRDLEKYKLIIHCGACMLTRRQMLFRIQRAKEAGVAITNYGVCIAFLQGILERVLEPFDGVSEIAQKTADVLDI